MSGVGKRVEVAVHAFDPHPPRVLIVAAVAALLTVFMLVMTAPR